MLNITIFGDINIDWRICHPDVNLPLDSVNITLENCIDEQIGGGGVNFARAACDVGMQASLIGKVGADINGQQIKKSLIDRGIKPYLVFDDNFDTGRVIAIIDKNDKRFMISHRGANVRIHPSEISESFLERSDLFYLSGYTLLRQPQSLTSLRLIDICKKINIPVVLDVVPHRIFNDGISTEYKDALSLADCIVTGIGTARRILNLRNANIDDIACNLAKKYCFSIVYADNETQYCVEGDSVEIIKTGYSSAKDKVGLLDRSHAIALKKYLTIIQNTNKQDR